MHFCFVVRIFFFYTIRVSNSLDPDLGPICLQNGGEGRGGGGGGGGGGRKEREI